MSLQQFKNDSNEVFGYFFDDTARSSKSDLFAQTESLPLRWILKKDNLYLFEVEVPGVNPKDVDIKLSGTIMTIKDKKSRHDEHKNNSYKNADSRT